MSERQKYRIAPEKITQPCLILVEGDDDARFIDRLLKHCNLKDNTQVLEINGKSEFRFSIQLALKERIVQAICCIQDADDCPSDALHALRAAISNAGIAPPEEPCEIGIGPPSIAYLLLPLGDIPGCIESFLLPTVRQLTDEHRACIDTLYTCVQHDFEGRVAVWDESRLLVTMALWANGTRSVGLAAERNHFNLDHPILDPLKDFLRRFAECCPNIPAVS